MKKAIILFLFGALVGSVRAADYNYLVFTLTDGTTQAVASGSLTITFADGNLVAANGSSTLATIPLALVSKMEFSNDGTTAISTITVDTLLTDQTAEVYDMSGRRMPSGSSLPKGVYILKTNGRTIKVQIR